MAGDADERLPEEPGEPANLDKLQAEAGPHVDMDEDDAPTNLEGLRKSQASQSIRNGAASGRAEASGDPDLDLRRKVRAALVTEVRQDLTDHVRQQRLKQDYSVPSFEVAACLFDRLAAEWFTSDRALIRRLKAEPVEEVRQDLVDSV